MFVLYRRKELPEIWIRRIGIISFLLGSLIIPILGGSWVTYIVLERNLRSLHSYDKHNDEPGQIHVVKINAQMIQNSQYNMTCKGASNPTAN